ncbi:phosphoribosylaminoimidazole carboxylase [Cavenderia fasciculata]|uniref:Phosphoribosylaminoimidazole carboxylase n=1 Tax=Cavenderia fasciculata TaxID=261658 RepID=F4Q311_CACFS|nr:phosphoribosylaminoimidazole carboxylase [Cavenderia fasciculata]EGG17575.1 phosphoribosylaminoimidazole carboxylase [Cavenderia fasciculata]|eukprot:XP_004356059.1 phosphoribosylaminoimidazole carboxylase [Cavenderia fasciculata]
MSNNNNNNNTASSSYKIFDVNDVTFLAKGKTKEIFKFNKDDQYVLVVSNSSITAGDGAKRDELPGKGAFSTTTACNVFRVLHLSNIGSHFIRQESPTSFIAKRCSMIPLEVIVRRLATGSYLKRNPQIVEGSRFNPCLIEFTFKDDENHDPLVTEQDILKMDLKIGGVAVTSKLLSNIRNVATLAFEALEKAWQSLDVVLVDFKVEFGITPQGELILADVVDNDSWRIWLHGDKNLMKDKQVYRNLGIKEGAPKVGTLTQEQTQMLIDNYTWVANQSNKLVDYTINSNFIAHTPSRHTTMINNILSPSPLYSPLPQPSSSSHHIQQKLQQQQSNFTPNSSDSIPLLPVQPLLPTVTTQQQTNISLINSNKPMVGIIMGSQSDWDVMKLASNTLTQLGIPHETKIVSAHRTPDRMFEYAKSARSRGLKVIIAGAGGAAHLPGMVAALTSLPVFGVPVQSKALSGVDSLLSICQMPAGIPVGTLAIGAAGATNAALLAASVLSPFYPAIESSLETFRKNQTDAVADSPSDNVTNAGHHHQTVTPKSSEPIANITSILNAHQVVNPSSSSSQSNITIQSPLPLPHVGSSHHLHPHSSSSPNAAVQSPVRSQSPNVITNTIEHNNKGPLSAFVLSSIRPSLVLPPGSTIGILGGGQLARMIVIAAAQLGYKTHVFCPESDSSASHVATETTKSNYNNYANLDIFASKVDVVTYEFENIMVEPVEYLAKKVGVFPDPKVLRICQDRVQEKRFIQSLDVPTAAFEPIDSLDTLKTAIQKVGYPAILKSNTMGYDGKGQVKITDQVDLESAWKKVTNETGAQRAILEQYIEFEGESSVIVARTIDSTELCFPLVTNKHRNHILRQTIAPAPLPPAVHAQAKEIATKIGKGIGLVGILAVELFVVKQADGNYKLLVNELAPRPHNSGHWTIEGCVTSQFEQLVRCICGLPLGSVDLMKRITEKEYLEQPAAQQHPIVMTNLLGAEVETWEKHLSIKGCHLHIYAKGDIKEGRKMGHINQTN